MSLRVNTRQGIADIEDDLNRILVLLVDQLGCAAFHESLAEAANVFTGSESCLIAQFDSSGGATPLYHNLDATLTETSITPYFAGAYLLDPFYTLFRNSAGSGIYRLRDCAPDDFYNSEYYRSYYLNTGLVDELGILFRISHDSCIVASCGNRGKKTFSATKVRGLQAAINVLEALCRKHLSMIQADAMPAPLQRPLDVAFRNFGKDLLSQREREVVQFILKGHSNKSIAKLLDISLDTVKVYNKRFHAKLNVSSQAELFSLFLEAISTAPLEEDIDPLTHLGFTVAEPASVVDSS